MSFPHPIHEFVALEIPFPYTPLLSSSETDTQTTFYFTHPVCFSPLYMWHTVSLKLLVSLSFVTLLPGCILGNSASCEMHMGRVGWVGMIQTDILYADDGRFQ